MFHKTRAELTIFVKLCLRGSLMFRMRKVRIVESTTAWLRYSVLRWIQSKFDMKSKGIYVAFESTITFSLKRRLEKLLSESVIDPNRKNTKFLVFCPNFDFNQRSSGRSCRVAIIKEKIFVDSYFATLCLNVKRNFYSLTESELAQY